MISRKLLLPLVIVLSFLGFGEAGAQETIGSFSYAEIKEGGADRSSIATFGYNYEGGLVWKCEPNGLNVMFILPEALGGGSGDEIAIEYGFGGAAPSNRTTWSYSPADLLAIMPRDAVPAFTQAARGAGSITVRATDPASGSSDSYELTLDQLGSALQRLECAR